MRSIIGRLVAAGFGAIFLRSEGTNKENCFVLTGRTGPSVFMQNADIQVESFSLQNVMNGDDNLVLSYLGKFPNAFVSPMEVCKRAADRKRFAAEPDWAKPILIRLTQQHVLECNAVGHYKIKSEDEERKKHKKPYQPRPEPGAEAQPGTSEQKVETPVNATCKEDQKSASAPATQAAAAIPVKSGESTTNPPAQKDPQVPESLPGAGGYEPPIKKAA